MGETTGPEVVVYGSGDDEELLLSVEAVRVLGVLIEKQITTPDYYPLTLNALVNGCNQTTSRDPIVQYDETTVCLKPDWSQTPSVPRTRLPSRAT